ncbi:MAG: DUF4422 domain-containing protein [Pseudomonadota bacterium]
MGISLYAAYHAPAPVLRSDRIKPIHVGRATLRRGRAAPAPLDAMAGDDTGDNISARNPEFCELTALYWAWKNDRDSAWLGLLHYRRVLDFTGAHDRGEAEVFPARFDIAPWLAEADAWFDAHLEACDLVVPKLHRMERSMAENYVQRHAPADWEAARAIIARDHPDYLDTFDVTAARPEIRLGNMMLMRRALADRYCAWLFDILFKLEATEIERGRYSPRQRRYLGFIAERLFTVFVAHLQRTEPGLRLCEVNIVNMKDAAVFPTVADDRLNGPEHINIAFASDAAYVPHAAAMLHSMLTRTAPKRRINLFFLETNVPELELELLAEVVAIHPRATLHVIPVGNAFEGAYRSPSRAPSNATYNRFLLFDLLPGLDRLLYLDVDMIFRGDVAEIFDTEMGEAPLAAVTDYIMTRVLTGPTATIDSDVPDLYDYYSRRLGLTDDQIAGYFNAGLLLFNFAAMDVAATGRALVAKTRNGRYLFRDQDILNQHFAGRVLHLPGRMNVFNTVRAGYDRVPQENHAAAMDAKADPLLIHYAAGDYKPWKRIVPLGQYYWQAVMETPFAPRVLAAQGARGLAGQRSLSGRLTRRMVTTGRALADRAPALKPALFWVYRILRRPGR